MEETWLYQEGIEKGIEKGAEKERETWLRTLQGTALQLCEQRFGSAQAQEGQARIQQIQEPGLLSRLIVRLATASSLPEALGALAAT